MTFDERKAKILQFVKAYGAITNSDVQALNNVHRNTASGDLRRLVEENILISIGSKKGASYKLFESIIFSSQDLDSIFPSKEHASLEKYFRIHDRKKSFF